MHLSTRDNNEEIATKCTPVIFLISFLINFSLFRIKKWTAVSEAEYGWAQMNEWMKIPR